MTRKWTADWTLAHTEHSLRHTGPLQGAVKSRAAGLGSTQSYIWIYPGSIIRHKLYNETFRRFPVSRMWTGTTSIRDYISTPIRMCTFVCTLTYKHVFFLARTAKSVSQEWAQGTCKGSRVRNRHIHTHIFHPSSKTVLTGLFNRTKPQSLSIYNPPSFFLSLPFFFTLYFIYLRPHLNIDSAPGSSFMVHARVYVCMRKLVCVCKHVW